MSFEVWQAAVLGLTQRLDDQADNDEAWYAKEFLTGLTVVEGLEEQRVVRWLRSRIEAQIVAQMEPRFWSLARSQGSSQDPKGQGLISGLEQVRQYRQRLLQLTERGLTSQAACLSSALCRFLYLTVFEQHWNTLSPLLSRFFLRRLRAFTKLHPSEQYFQADDEDEDEEDEEEEENDDDNDDEENDEENEDQGDDCQYCGCTTVDNQAENTNESDDEDEENEEAKEDETENNSRPGCKCEERVIGAVGRLADAICVKLCYELMKKHVSKYCEGKFNRHGLSSLVSWCQQVPLRWIGQIFGRARAPATHLLEQQILGELYTEFFLVRNKELFDIIVDMPESTPAVEDLRDCIRSAAALSAEPSSLLLSHSSESLSSSPSSANVNVSRLFALSSSSSLTNLSLLSSSPSAKSSSSSMPTAVHDWAIALLQKESIENEEDKHTEEEEEEPLTRRLISNLRQSFSTRLLHHGVNTSDILTQYISTIKTFRILDPSGQALALVSQPLKAYLVKRPDTARQIVASLTDSQSSLYRELLSSNQSANPAAPIEPTTTTAKTPTAAAANDEGDPTFEKFTLQELIDDDGGDDTLAYHENWRPAPPPGDPSFSETSTTGQVIDIIHTLVSVYGSKELFVKEYKRLLSDRLLQNTTFETDQDDQTLELLKLRFGEAALEDCVVMLRDIYDSKLINKQLQTSAKLSPMLRTLIISGLYWPKLKPEEFNHPAAISRLIKDFETAYESHKHLRKLEWIHQVGTVDLEFEFDDGRQLALSVEPLQAAIIAPFSELEQGTDGLSLTKLAEVVGIPASRARKTLGFWTKKGVLFESAPDFFQVIEDEEAHRQSIAQRAGALTASNSSSSSSSSASSSAASSSSAAQSSSSEPTAAPFTEDEMMAQAFVHNMLKNTGALALETIHLRLGMFFPDFEVTVPQLGQFLQRLMLADKIELSMDGLYSLK